MHLKKVRACNNLKLVRLAYQAQLIVLKTMNYLTLGSLKAPYILKNYPYHISLAVYI